MVDYDLFNPLEEGEKMIIWINGSFGVGKTSTAELLKNELDNSIIYDPEEIGGFLSNMFHHEKDDFQDYELFRTLNFDILKYLCSIHEIVIVPMTITNKQYYDEIINELETNGINIEHFILCASKEKIISRLDSRGNSTKWAYNQVDKCINAFESNRFRCKKINTDDMNVSDVVKSIIEAIQLTNKKK